MTESTITPQDQMQRDAFAVYGMAMSSIADFLNDPGPKDPEVVIKILNSKVADVARVIPEKKIDPYGNLPTVSFTFVNGTMTASVVPAVDQSQPQYQSPLAAGVEQIEDAVVLNHFTKLPAPVPDDGDELAAFIAADLDALDDMLREPGEDR